LVFSCIASSSCSAVAATASSVSSFSAAEAILPSFLQQQQQFQRQQHNITVRLARRTDVPGIQQCNLNSLPENYNSQFYINHLRQWPELSLVAECCFSDKDKKGKKHLSNFLSHSSEFPGDEEETSKHIVAYVLGKVEERGVDQEEAFREAYDDGDFDENAGYRSGLGGSRSSSAFSYQRELLGHVTSLAVLEPFRRRGLAVELMKQLHLHMQHCYPNVDSVGLHVRESNKAAVQLYKNFGYTAADIIPAYYQDGEDAYFMKKEFASSAQEPLSPSTSVQKQEGEKQQQVPSSLFGSLQRRLAGRQFQRQQQRRPWQTGPSELRLPRIVHNSSSKSSTSLPQPHLEERDDEETPELLAGTM